jgi:hypothetical protein
VNVNMLLRAGRLPAVGALGVLLAVATASAAPAAASTPASGGALVTIVQPQPADAAADLIGRAATVRDALGFPVGHGRSARHAVDRSRGAEYDAVEETGADGALLAEFRFTPSGRLEHAVRLDVAGPADRRLSGARASTTARMGLAALALMPSGAESVDADAVQGGWQVHWARAQRGVPVRGDEVRVHVRSDGSIGSVAWVEHELAAEPATRMIGSAAAASVRARADGWFAGTDSGCRIGSAVLQWVEPNGLFDPAVPMTDAGPYRLAWVVDVRPTGPAAMSLTLVTVFIDAGDGSVIGGDVIQ